MTLPVRIPQTYQAQADLFRVLSHPVRLAIVSVLKDGEQCVCHMEAILGLRQSYISQHLMVLREAGLVQDRRAGWNVFYRITRPQVRRLSEALSALGGTHSTKSVRARPPITCPCPKCAQQRPAQHATRSERHEHC